MRTSIFVSLLCFLLLALTGCEKRAATRAIASANTESGSARFNVCGLITSEEIKAVQGSPIADTKSSESSNGGFRVSQCYYAATESNKSVSLAVTQSDPDSPVRRNPRDFWKETFGRYEGEIKEREGDKEKRESLRERGRAQGGEEAATPPRKIDGVGDQAYWTGNRVGGALYVLKKNAFIRIGVGGPGDEQSKIDKSKALAQKAIDRL